MANRNVIYEACFEDYLRQAGIPYVAVDEAKKAIFAGVYLKSFDFVVYSRAGPNLLVDVKGRRFPYRGGRRWENWATRDDLDSLARWEEVFGSGFAGLLVFCYHLVGDGEEGKHSFRYYKFYSLLTLATKESFTFWILQIYEDMRFSQFVIRNS